MASRGKGTTSSSRNILGERSKGLDDYSAEFQQEINRESLFEFCQEFGLPLPKEKQNTGMGKEKSKENSNSEETYEICVLPAAQIHGHFQPGWNLERV